MWTGCVRVCGRSQLTIEQLSNALVSSSSTTNLALASAMVASVSARVELARPLPSASAVGEPVVGESSAGAAACAVASEAAAV